MAYSYGNRNPYIPASRDLAWVTAPRITMPTFEVLDTEVVGASIFLLTAKVLTNHVLEKSNVWVPSSNSFMPTPLATNLDWTA